MFDGIIVLHAMDEENVQCLSHWKVKVDIICSKDLFIYDV